MGVALPSVDRMLAQIDRELAPSFRLPVGGPLVERPAKCWADFSSVPWAQLLEGKPELYASLHNLSGCSADPETTVGLCLPHYAQMIGDGPDA